jgi:hypothetical protein
LDLENDIVYHDFSNKESNTFLNQKKEDSFSYEDTDNDGIADYAESNILNFDPNKYDDILSMHPGTILTITTVDGVQHVPLYQTSYYQEKMLEINISSFNSDPWTDTQKERVRYYFSDVKKVWLTPEFYDHVTNTLDSEKATSFFKSFRTVKRDVEFRHSYSSGSTDSFSYIGIAPRVMSDKNYRTYLPFLISNLLVHHIVDRFGREIASGTKGKAMEMILQGKSIYEVFDINKKTLYNKPCVPFSRPDNNNYHSIHFLKIPNTGLKIEKHWKGDYEVYATPVIFKRGNSYESITQFLTGGKYSIWIDFNDDAEFDESEQLLENVGTLNHWKEAKYNFSIPENANTGVHRLRIVKSTYHPATACHYAKGQAIDFTNVTVY